jgi:hypothetical protein
MARTRIVLVGLVVSFLLASAAVGDQLLQGWRADGIVPVSAGGSEKAGAETLLWRVEQVEKVIQELREGQVHLTYLLLANLVAVIVSLVIYIATRRQRR